MGGDMPERRAPSTAGSDDSGAAAVRPEEQRHRWRRNPALSPQVKLAPHYISMGGDMPERRAPSTAGSDESGAAAVRPEEQRPRWRRNPALSPQVKLAPHYISAGGDMPARPPHGAAPSYDSGAAAVRPEEQRHRWRRNPALSPQVKLAPHYISTGGDMPERRAPSTAG